MKKLGFWKLWEIRIMKKLWFILLWKIMKFCRLWKIMNLNFIYFYCLLNKINCWKIHQLKMGKNEQGAFGKQSLGKQRNNKFKKENYGV